MRWWSSAPPGAAQHKLIPGSLSDSASGASHILLGKEAVQTTMHPFLSASRYRSKQNILKWLWFLFSGQP